MFSWIHGRVDPHGNPEGVADPNKVQRSPNMNPTQASPNPGHVKHADGGTLMKRSVHHMTAKKGAHEASAQERLQRRCHRWFIAALLTQLFLAIGAVVCGLTKITVASHYFPISNGIYAYVFGILAALSGTFDATNKISTNCNYRAHVVLGTLTFLAYVFLIVVNVCELEYDFILDRSKIDDLSTKPGRSQCDDYCKIAGASSATCACTYNEIAVNCDLAAIAFMGAALVCLTLSLTISSCVLLRCGAYYVRGRSSRSNSQDELLKPHDVKKLIALKREPKQTLVTPTGSTVVKDVEEHIDERVVQTNETRF